MCKLMWTTIWGALGLFRHYRGGALCLFKGTQSNLSQVSIECIDKVIQNALIFYVR